MVRRWRGDHRLRRCEALRRRGLEIGLRTASIGASLLLIMALAWRLGQEAFAASQLAMIAVGLALMASDSGLTLWTTRSLVQGQVDHLPVIFGTRVTVGGLGLLLAAAVAGVGGSRAGTLLVSCLAPYFFAIVVRNHLFAQLRACIGVSFELIAAPVGNTIESLAGVVGLLVFRHAAPAYLAMSLAAVGSTSALVSVARRRAEVSLRLRPFSATLFLFAGRAGFVPLGMGAALKTFGLVAGRVWQHGGAEIVSLSWLLTSVRVLDAAFSYVATLVIIRDHAARAGGRLVPRSRGVASCAALLFVSSVLGPIVLLNTGPTIVDLGISTWAALLATLLFLASRDVHLVHAAGLPRQGWLVLTLSQAQSVLLPAVSWIGSGALPLLIAVTVSSFTAAAVLSARLYRSVVNARVGGDGSATTAARWECGEAAQAEASSLGQGKGLCLG